MPFRIRYIFEGVALIVLLVWIYILLSAYRRGRHVSVCPVCGSDRLRPSWPKRIDGLIMLRCGVTPVRCEACLARFYKRK